MHLMTILPRSTHYDQRPMRTFPRALSTFRIVVNERGQRLRGLAFGELQQLHSQPIECLTVESRQATIGTIVQVLPDGSIRVVLQGFLKARWVPGRHVAIDGFYKWPDGSVKPMPTEEFYGFD